MIIFDNHLHLRRDGRFLEAAREFKEAGGTHFVLCQYPMPSVVLQEKSYLPVYVETLVMAEEVEEKTGVKVFVTVGPYPVDYLLFREKLGREQAVVLMKKGMDEAAKLCEEQERCIAIGEIGRPHFRVDEEALMDSNEILRYGMECARDVDVPVVLHTESTTSGVCRELVMMGKKAGLKPHKIVKHFSPPLIFFEENHGLMPSVLASKKNVEEALRKGSRFLMETDYIDDVRRPGAVLSPRTVPKQTVRMLRNGLMTERQVYRVHKENPEETYGIVLEE
ncbi:MAG TPA: metal-dependent hydrolase [Thermoplasmatales archaeon]|nr:metal-dependent hydrolase [Thermoplasmatales archaeon]